MRVKFRIGECSEILDLEDLLGRFDADTHDPDQGVFDCPVCGRQHYVNSIRCNVVGTSSEESCLANKSAILACEEGLINFYILYAKGDSQ